MKNYPHLYPNLKKHNNNITKSPKKTTTATGLTFSSKASMKTIGPYTNTLNRDKKINIRALTRSIEEIHCHSEVQNQQLYHGQMTELPIEDEELFSQSYSKIGKIKQTFPYKNIDLQLNQVLNLIKQQKLKIGQKIKSLKRNNEYYKKICEGTLINRIECAINTQEMINGGNEIVCLDQSVECYLEQQQQPQKLVDKTDSSLQQGIQSRQVYQKLSKMLQEMNINPKDILPSEQKLSSQIMIEDCKILSQKETIKIQKFFIKKLIQKIPK